jgi:hypothetical protein
MLTYGEIEKRHSCDPVHSADLEEDRGDLRALSLSLPLSMIINV